MFHSSTNALKTIKRFFFFLIETVFGDEVFGEVCSTDLIDFEQAEGKPQRQDLLVSKKTVQKSRIETKSIVSKGFSDSLCSTKHKFLQR